MTCIDSFINVFPTPWSHGVRYKTLCLFSILFGTWPISKAFSLAYLCHSLKTFIVYNNYKEWRSLKVTLKSSNITDYLYNT